jgi:hypothetical protein
MHIRQKKFQPHFEMDFPAIICFQPINDLISCSVLSGLVEDLLPIIVIFTNQNTSNFPTLIPEKPSSNITLRNLSVR